MRSDDAIPDRVLLIYGAFRLGGIETLILRLAKWFRAQGKTVDVFGVSFDPSLSTGEVSVNWIAYQNTDDLEAKILEKFSFFPRGERALMVSFDPISAARALLLETRLQGDFRIVHISGVFHPRAFFMDGERSDRNWLNKQIARSVGWGRMFFMNQECSESHSKQWGVDLSTSPVIPLPISSLPSRWKNSTEKPLRIASVGRLVAFKAYNKGAVKLVRECIEQGIEVTWDIFGDGPLKSEMEKEINASGLADKVRLRGELDYSLMSNILGDYDLFVGMGTAAVEASMLGLPTIVPVVDDSFGSHGFIFDLPFGNVGERIAALPITRISALVMQFALMTKPERSRASTRSREASLKYGMDVFGESLGRLYTRSLGCKPGGGARIIALLSTQLIDGPIVSNLRKIRSIFSMIRRPHSL